MGRSAEIIVENMIVGYIGEVDPEILEKNNINVPMSGFEIDLTLIPKYNINRYYSNDH